MSAGSVANRQIRFLWLLDPSERWPALPVLVLCIFDCVGHRVETVWQVEVLDALPLVVYELASVDADHAVILLDGLKGCAAGNQWRAKNRNPRRALQRASSPGGASSVLRKVFRRPQLESPSHRPHPTP